VESLGASSGAIAALLRALTVVATYESAAAEPLTLAWPKIMARGLAVLDGTVTTPNEENVEVVDEPPGASMRGRARLRNRNNDRELTRQLVPAPSPLLSSIELGPLLESASKHWLPLKTVMQGMDAWITHARGDMSAADSLIGFLRMQPLAEQADPGLAWARALIVADDGTALTNGFLLIPWLEDLHKSGMINEKSRLHYLAVVDALALSQFSGARELQQRDE
jgi:hypothetical protein